MAGNNDDVNETTNVDNFDESAVMNNIEVHSTPNVSQDNKIKINVTDETNITAVSYTHLDVYKRQSYPSTNNRYQLIFKYEC